MPNSFTAICILVFIAIITSLPVAHAKDTTGEPAVLYFYAKGWSPIANAYNTQILKHALDASTSKFGPYQLEIIGETLSPSRARAEIIKGKKFHIDFISGVEIDKAYINGTTMISFPLYKGILGLRRLIINPEDEKRFSTIDSLGDIRSLAVGQGRGWPDSKIYRKAGIKVVESVNFDSLFPMLNLKRFDYIPLSIIEAGAAVESYSKDNDLHLASNIYVFYPIPIHITVSANQPRISERIQYGLAIIKKNGKADALFKQFFSAYTNTIDQEKSRVFMLPNTALSEADNNKHTISVIDQFFSSSKKIIYVK